MKQMIDPALSYDRGYKLVNKNQSQANRCIKGECQIAYIRQRGKASNETDMCKSRHAGRFCSIHILTGKGTIQV